MSGFLTAVLVSAAAALLQQLVVHLARTLWEERRPADA
jgi:hypothetical protein